MTFDGAVKKERERQRIAEIPTDQLSLELLWHIKPLDYLPKTLAAILSQGFEGLAAVAPRVVEPALWAGVQGTLAHQQTDEVVAGDAQGRNGVLLAGSVSHSAWCMFCFVIGFQTGSSAVAPLAVYLDNLSLQI